MTPNGLKDEFRIAVDTIPGLVWSATPDGNVDFVNVRWLEYSGLSLEDATGHGWQKAVYPGDLPGLLEIWKKVLESGKPGEAVARLRRFDGVDRWFLFRTVPHFDEQGMLIKWYGTTVDIEERTRAETLLAGENQLLEMIAKGNPLSQILEELCRVVERIAQGSLISILLMDATGERLHHGAAPSLPRSYTDAINGAHIGPHAGSCGACAYRKEPVFVADINSDPLWDRYRNLAGSHGLRACWSAPILSSTANVLGTFAIYSRVPGAPTAQQRNLIEHCTHLASIAIERRQFEDTLKRSKAYMVEAQRLSRTGSCSWKVATDDLFWSDEVYSIYAMEKTAKPTFELVRKRIHPDDAELFNHTVEQATREGKDFEFEHRLLMDDGTVKHLHIAMRAIRNDSGVLAEFVGAVMDITEITSALREIKALRDQLYKENLALKEEIHQSSMFEDIVGDSPALKAVLARVAKVAPTDSTVLITGETGTGKELIARAIHKRSQRSERAFVSVNCAAISPSLIASELFGHEKGAFTGALQRRAGRFELAEGGTIFLDEVGELPPETQVALLRVLQEREYERVGGNQLLKADVRVIAATNRDLQAAIVTDSFRSDLYYRFNVFPIEMPALRDRREDICLLAKYFIEHYARKAGKKIPGINEKTLDLLQTYDWPGNIRELQNVIERSMILCETETFSVDESWLSRRTPKAQSSAATLAKVSTEREKEMIEAALAAAEGRVSGKSGAAAKLGLVPSTLESKIKALKIDKSRFKPE